MSASSGGWLKLHRSMAQHPLWLCSPFNIGQAWLDLIMLANYRDSTSPRGDLKVVRGQVLTSIESMGLRWGRDRKTVRAWLLTFERAGMLARASAHGRDGGYTLLTMLNYEKFQGPGSDALDDGRADGRAYGLDDGRADALDDGMAYGRDPSKKREGQERKEREKRAHARARTRRTPSTNGHQRAGTGTEIDLSAEAH